MNHNHYAELEALRRLVKEQELIIKAQEDRIEKQENKIDNLIQALRQSTKQIFGTSSEKSHKLEGQQTLFNDEILLAKELLKDCDNLSTKNNPNKKPKPKPRQVGVRKEVLKQLPTQVIICDINEEETCPICEQEFKKIGSRVIRSEVNYTPPKLVVKQYVQRIYKCSECGTSNSPNSKDTFVKAYVPKNILSHSIASPSIVAKIMYDKYALGLPLYRQEKAFEQLGLILPRTNMANWMIRCSEMWLEPIYKRIHQMLLKTKVLHSDETYLQCNKEPGRKANSKSYMWVLCSGEQEPRQGVFFYYTKTREMTTIKYLLSGYQGYLVTDAYSGYNSIDEAKHAYCWAHARRYHIESIPLDNKGKEIKGSKGAQGRTFCNQLFEIERQIDNLPKNEKEKKREELSKPVLEAYWWWIEETLTLNTANTKLIKALNYSLNQRKGLEIFLKDGEIPLSNNRCENALRPYVTGRKGWLFADTQKGAKASSIIYTIVETAKANQLNVYNYIQFLLETLPNMDYLNQPKLLDHVLPWSETLPDYCKLQGTSKH